MSWATRKRKLSICHCDILAVRYCAWDCELNSPSPQGCSVVRVFCHRHRNQTGTAAAFLSP